MEGGWEPTMPTWRMILQVGGGFKRFFMFTVPQPVHPPTRKLMNDKLENPPWMKTYFLLKMNVIVLSGVPLFVGRWSNLTHIFFKRVAQPPTKLLFPFHGWAELINELTFWKDWLWNYIISVKSRENKRQTIQWLMSSLTKKSKHQKVARWFERYFSSHFHSFFFQNKTTTRLATLKERGVTGRIMTPPMTNLYLNINLPDQAFDRTKCVDG